MQCLLLSDGKSSGHPNHVVILPGDGGSGMAAISFLGALRIPVSGRWADVRWVRPAGRHLGLHAAQARWPWHRVRTAWSQATVRRETQRSFPALLLGFGCSEMRNSTFHKQRRIFNPLQKKRLL